MLANFLQLITRRSPAKDYDLAFVKNVSINPPREARNRSAELWLVAGWLCILLKSSVIWWAIRAYDIPIHPMWLVGPTVLFGLLATGLYIWRD